MDFINSYNVINCHPVIFSQRQNAGQYSFYNHKKILQSQDRDGIAGKLVGIKKVQISKIENNTKDVRFSTVLRVFEALMAKVIMTIEFDPNSHMEIA